MAGSQQNFCIAEFCKEFTEAGKLCTQCDQNFKSTAATWLLLTANNTPVGYNTAVAKYLNLLCTLYKELDGYEPTGCFPCSSLSDQTSTSLIRLIALLTDGSLLDLIYALEILLGENQWQRPQEDQNPNLKEISPLSAWSAQDRSLKNRTAHCLSS